MISVCCRDGVVGVDGDARGTAAAPSLATLCGRSWASCACRRPARSQSVPVSSAFAVALLWLTCLHGLGWSWLRQTCLPEMCLREEGKRAMLKKGNGNVAWRLVAFSSKCLRNVAPHGWQAQRGTGLNQRLVLRRALAGGSRISKSQVEFETASVSRILQPKGRGGALKVDPEHPRFSQQLGQATLAWSGAVAMRQIRNQMRVRSDD